MQSLAIAAARQYLGVKFHHQGRSRAEGMDCLGLLLAVAEDMQLSFAPEIAELQRRCDYTHSPNIEELRAGLDASLQQKPRDSMQAGDVVLLNVQGRAQHLGLIADYPVAGELSIIHAYAMARKVVEHRLDAAWMQAIVAVYALPEVG